MTSLADRHYDFRCRTYCIIKDAHFEDRSTAGSIVSLSTAVKQADPEQITNETRGAMRMKVDDEMRREVEVILRENAAMTLKDMNAELEGGFPTSCKQVILISVAYAMVSCSE